MNSDFLKEIFSKVKNVNVLEEVENPKNVYEYLNLAVELRKDIDKEKILAEKDHIFDTDCDTDDLKKLLIQLASVDDLEAYKTLEKFSTTQRASEVKDFITIALQESRALLQSTLLGEPTILITSGLGGKQDKLRYFIVIMAKDLKPFTSIQKQIIEKEISFFAENNNCAIEQVHTSDLFSSVILLIPYQMSPSEIIKSLIDSINEMGDFINPNFILRNDKIIPTDKLANIIDRLITGEIKLNEVDTFLEDNNSTE